MVRSALAIEQARRAARAQIWRDLLQKALIGGSVAFPSACHKDGPLDVSGDRCRTSLPADVVHCIANSLVNALNADLDNVAFFDKADDTASRGLRRDMVDVFALAGGVATTIFERAK